MLREDKKSLSMERILLKFGILTDLHMDLVPDGQMRLNIFLDAMKKEAVDFIVQLGDIAKLKSMDKDALQQLKETNIPILHVLGNHDTDDCTKEEACSILGLQESYYSYRLGEMKIIVLDTNYSYEEGSQEYTHFDLTNVGKRTLPYIPPQQLNWLEDELKEPCSILIFSHSGFYPVEEQSVVNGERVQELVKEINAQAGYRKIIACIHGHYHFDTYHLWEDIHHIGIPSITCQWINCQGDNTKISPSLAKKYPGLKRMVMYTEPLFSLLSLEDKILYIQGAKSAYAQDPREFGQEMVIDQNPLTPIIRERVLSL